MLIHYWRKIKFFGERLWVTVNAIQEILLYELTILLRTSVTPFIFRTKNNYFSGTKNMQNKHFP